MPEKPTITENLDDWGPLSGLPGNPIMWLLIASELVVFGAIFIGFSATWLSDPEMFASSQDQLDRLAGAVNTMILITSGLCAALAVHYRSKNKILRTRLWLMTAIFFGFLFLGVKWIEYADKFSVGISTETNSFFMFYYLATGFHAMHVIFGILVLIVVAWKSTMDNIITGTAFWHMIDLIWVILFPLIYLMR